MGASGFVGDRAWAEQRYDGLFSRLKAAFRWPGNIMRNGLHLWLHKFRDMENPGLRRWVARQAALVPVNALVLDVGAGQSPYKALFAHCRYMAHDFCGNPSKTYGEMRLVSDITAIPMESGRVDVVLCTQVLEHIYEPTAALREMSRLMKTDGILLMTIPLASGIHEPPYHFYGGFTPFWVEKAFHGAGFGEITIEYNGGWGRYLAHELLMFPSYAKRRVGGSRGVFAEILVSLCLAPAIICARLLDTSVPGERKTLNLMIRARKVIE